MNQPKFVKFQWVACKKGWFTDYEGYIIRIRYNYILRTYRYQVRSFIFKAGIKKETVVEFWASEKSLNSTKYVYD